MRIQKRLVGLILVAGVMGVAPATWAQDASWAVGAGDWSNPNNWSPIGVPTLTDEVFIGDLASVANATVQLDQNDTVSGLQLLDGMWLYNNALQLIVLGDTLVSDVNQLPNYNRVSLLELTAVPGGVTAFDTDTLTLRNGGGLSLFDGPIVEIDQWLRLEDGTTLSGYGHIRLRGNQGRVLENNGTISARRGELTIEALGSGLIDLDGDDPAGVSPTGNIQVSRDTTNATPERLTIIAPNLPDSYDGSIFLSTDTILDMQLDSPWRLAGWMRFGGNDINVPAIVMGAPIEIGIGGLIDVDGSAAFARFDCDTTFDYGTAEVHADQRLKFAGATVIGEFGNSFRVSQGGMLEFSGPTHLMGGSFYYYATPDADPNIEFSGDTTFEGDIWIRGLAAQTGDATVVQTSRVNQTEHGAIYDLDGKGGTSQTWTINAPFYLNVDGIANEIAPGSSDPYSGTMTIANGPAPKIGVYLSNPLDAWQLDGTIDLTGDAKSYTRIEGNHLVVVDSGPKGPSGVMTLATGLAKIDAPVTYQDGSTLSVGSKLGPASLEFAGVTIFESGANIIGPGTVLNSATNTMTIAEGTTVPTVNVANLGDLTVADGPGTLELATLDSSSSKSTLGFTLDGSIFGIRATRVDASTAVDLGGTLRVVYERGLPRLPPGASATLIASPARNGRFDDLELPYGYRWSVQYSRTNGDVTLRVIERTGDMNCDGVINFFDIDPFVTALIDPTQYALDYPNCDMNQADVNDDGAIDFFDIDPFVWLLVGG